MIEIGGFLSLMYSRAAAMFQVTEAARKALAVLDGQIDMEGGQ